MHNIAEHDFDVRVPTLRDLVTPLFRYWRAGVLVAVAVAVGAATFVLLTPKQYEAEMKLLVKRQRADPIVSADPTATAQLRTDVTEDELNSEVELLKSRDLLAHVATASGLLGRADAPDTGEHGAADAATVKGVRQLESALKIAPIKKTMFIKVTYRSPDPRLAARVLTTLSTLYLEKHRELHHTAGAYDFFTKQADRYQAELAAAEDRLNEYSRREDVVSGELEQQNTLQRLAEFESALQQARAKIAESDRTIADVQRQIAQTPDRQTTQIRTSENAALTHDLKSRVLTLETKRAEMLRKFMPTYPPVKELEDQIEQANNALAASERSPLTERTTDQNPTYQWLRGELARVKSERAAAIARADAFGQSIRMFREQARQLERKAAAQDDLKRAVKSAEETYLLYKRRQEEARITDALDRTRIANVAVAEAPTVPPLPANTGRSSLLVLGGLLALVLGAAATYVLDYVTPYFHAPQDVESLLDVPVLAAFPARETTPVAATRSFAS